MGFHFDTVAAAEAHIASVDLTKVSRGLAARIQFKIEKYADGSCLLLIHDPKGAA